MSQGIRVEGVTSRPHKKSGVVVHTGRVAEGQTGYRAVKEEELNPQSSPDIEHGYRSRGTYNTKIERGSRGTTMFSANPISQEEMQRHGYTHQIEADISGLPFRTLRKPEGDHVAADLGLGLGVKGEMDWSRIKRLHGPEGEVLPDEAPHIGQQFKQHIQADTGRTPRGQ